MCVLLPCTYLIALILVPCISFVHVVWPHGFSLGYLQVMSFHEKQLVSSFHDKQLVSHLPTRQSCFAPSFLSCFLYVLQHKHLGVCRSLKVRYDLDYSLTLIAEMGDPKHHQT